MRTIILTIFSLVVAIAPITSFAQTQSFEGVAAIAGASINPPDPIDGCKRAKQDAVKKAEAAGFKGTVVWDHLSNDSDCKLTTQRAGSAGTYFIFTSKGTFSKMAGDE